MKTLVIERDFAASRDALWKALTDPARLAAWYGPEGWGVSPGSVSIDCRVGGHQRFELQSLDHPAHKSPVDAVYSEVREPELLVHLDGPHAMTLGLVIELRIELAETPSGTHLVLRQGKLPAELVELSHSSWESSFRKLDRLLLAG